MTQIFVFTAGDPAARAHLRDSIAQPLDLEIVLKTVQDADREPLQAIHDREGGLWAWGAVPSERNRLFWDKMMPGDWAACVYDNTYRYVARVIFKFEHEALARGVWGETPEGQTWSLMYFLSRPTEIAKPVSAFATYLNNGYRGFTKIGDERNARLVTDYGSVDKFVESALLASGSEPLSHFLIRSNEDSDYADELGIRYHFTNTVPNSRSLAGGGLIVVDRKTPSGPVVIGYGDLEPARREERDGKTHFTSSFRSWMPLEPRPLNAKQRTAVQGVDGYNVQHAVRPITPEVYAMLTEESRTTPAAATDLRRAADSFASALREAHVSFGIRHDALVRAFVASLATKPLVILTGLTGSGKTQIAVRLGEWLGGHLLTSAVRPDWTGSEALFGYEDGLRPLLDGQPAWVVPTALEFMLDARDNSDQIHVLVLDEMNLAHVERYFADALSGMESQQPCLPNLTRGADGCWRAADAGNPRVPLPKNLWIVGTVNVDETTYMFSPKVLDRANTFEFRVSTSDLSPDARKPRPCAPADGALVTSLLSIANDPEWHLDHPATFGEELAAHLLSLHALLTRFGYEFGHRTYFESMRFAAMAEQAGVGQSEDVLDRIVMQKILPRLHGARRRLELPLLALLQFCGDLSADAASDTELPRMNVESRSQPARLPLSFDKGRRMLQSLRANQFVSFTE